MKKGSGLYALSLDQIPPMRLERMHPAPEAGALSTELRGHQGFQPHVAHSLAQMGHFGKKCAEEFFAQASSLEYNLF